MLLFDNGANGKSLPQVMELAFGHPSLALPRPQGEQDIAEINGLVETAMQAGRPTYLVVTDGDLAWWPDRWTLEGQGASILEISGLAQPRGRLPTAQDVVRRKLNLDVYRVIARAPMPSAVVTGAVPLGPGSYPYLRSGFWWWEQDGPASYVRWTDGDGEVSLPWPTPDTEDAVDFCLEVSLAGGRPPSATPGRIRLEAEGVVLLEQQLLPGFEPQLLQVAARDIVNKAGPELEIRLASNTWTPEGEWRELGVLLFDMEIESLQRCGDGS